MSTAAYPIAIWGVGPAGRNYLRQIQRDWRVEVVGLINRNEERRQAVSAETGVPGFADLASLLAGAQRRPELVIIATANPTHEAFAIEALQAGLHVFCEKPMAADLDGCRRMIHAARAAGRVLQIGFEYRHGTMTRRLRELQQQGHFGALTCVDITDSRGHWWPERPDTPVADVWRLNPAKGGGPITHCGIHELDLLRYFGGEIAELQAFVPPRSLPFYPDGIPDHVNLQFRFRSGATGSFTLYHNVGATWYRPMPAWTPNYHRVPGHGLDITMTGSGGAALARIYAEELHLARYDAANRETVFVRSELFHNHHPDNTHHNTPGMILECLLRLRDGQPPLDDPEDALRTTALGIACEHAVTAAITDGWTSGRLTL
jgi:predicted dehydrogenase